MPTVRVIYFLGQFAKLRKATITHVMSVRLSARNNTAPTGWIFMIFYISVFFENLSRKFKFHQNLMKTYIFMKIFHSVFLRMKNVSDKNCRKNQNTHFIFSNFFSKIVLFVR